MGLFDSVWIEGKPLLQLFALSSTPPVDILNLKHVNMSANRSQFLRRDRHGQVECFWSIDYINL